METIKLPYVDKSGCYLLHAESKLAHSQHYCGWGKNVYTRVDAQLKNKRTAAKFVKAIHQAGIKLHLAQLWPGQGRKFERKLKDSHKLRMYCPICKGQVPVSLDVDFYPTKEVLS